MSESKEMGSGVNLDEFDDDFESIDEDKDVSTLEPESESIDESEVLDSDEDVFSKLNEEEYDAEKYDAEEPPEKKSFIARFWPIIAILAIGTPVLVAFLMLLFSDNGNTRIQQQPAQQNTQGNSFISSQQQPKERSQSQNQAFNTGNKNDVIETPKVTPESVKKKADKGYPRTERRKIEEIEGMIEKRVFSGKEFMELKSKVNLLSQQIASNKSHRATPSSSRALRELKTENKRLSRESNSLKKDIKLLKKSQLEMQMAINEIRKMRKKETKNVSSTFEVASMYARDGVTKAWIRNKNTGAIKEVQVGYRYDLLGKVMQINPSKRIVFTSKFEVHYDQAEKTK
jgi:cell division protein FtsB